jgi:hypothetical protein
VTDPWAFQRWAFETKTGSYARKAALVALAVMADASTGRCEAKQETLGQQTELSTRTVRKALKDLEAAGLVARRHQYRADGKRRGDEFLLLAPWIETWPDGLAARDDTSATSGTSRPLLAARDDPARTTTSRNSHMDSLRSSIAAARAFAADSNDLGQKVLGLLIEVAEAKDTNPFKVEALVAASRRYKDRDLAAEAEAFRFWYLEGNGENVPVKSLPGRWRTWLERAPSAATRSRAVRRRGRQDEDRAERLRKDLEAIERIQRGEA